MKLKTIKPKTDTISVNRADAPVAAQRIAGYALTKIRDRILLRDNYTCCACGRVSKKLVVDHIVPLHLGGAESDINRQSLCLACHKAKNDREFKERE